MLRISKILGVILTALLLAPPTARAAEPEMIDNPAYVSWAKHKPGTTVNTEMTMNMGAQQMTMKIAQALLGVEKDHALIETTSTMSVPGIPAGQGQKNKIKIPAKVAKGQENLPEGATGTAKPVGNEKVDVAGKSYDCRVVEFEGTAQGMKSTGKIWNSTEMPGAVVKMDMTTESPAGPGTMAMRVVSIETK